MTACILSFLSAYSNNLSLQPVASPTVFSRVWPFTASPEVHSELLSRRWSVLFLQCWALLSFPKSKHAALREHRWLIVTGKAEAGGGSLCLRVQQWLANSSIMASQCETVQIAS